MASRMNQEAAESTMARWTRPVAGCPARVETRYAGQSTVTRVPMHADGRANVRQAGVDLNAAPSTTMAAPRRMKVVKAASPWMAPARVDMPETSMGNVASNVAETAARPSIQAPAPRYTVGRSRGRTASARTAPPTMKPAKARVQGSQKPVLANWLMC